MCTRVQKSLQMHVKDPVSPYQGSEDYGNIKTSSIQRRLGSATLSQLAFPGGTD